MKHLYLLLFLLSLGLASAQEIPSHAEIKGLKLYPNPVFDNVVYITTDQNLAKEVVVYDVFGEVVLQERMASNTLNIARLVPGVYVLQVTESKKTTRRKLVVK